MLFFSLLDVKRATAGAKLLMRFASTIIDKYNALPEEERDNSSILGHLIRMQVPHERARLADVVGTSCVQHLFHILLLLLILTTFTPHTTNGIKALLMAGHETTSNQITWIMVELARHPDVLQKGDLHVFYTLAFSCTSPILY